MVGGGGLPFAPVGVSFGVFSLVCPVAVCFPRRRDFRAILPRFRACFGRLRVWRCVVRFAVSILTPFFAVSRLVSARLVQSIKATKKACFRGNFQGVLRSWCFRFRSGGCRQAWQDKKTIKKTGFCPVFRFICLLFYKNFQLHRKNTQPRAKRIPTTYNIFWGYSHFPLKN